MGWPSLQLIVVLGIYAKPMFTIRRIDDDGVLGILPDVPRIDELAHERRCSLVCIRLLLRLGDTCPETGQLLEVLGRLLRHQEGLLVVIGDLGLGASSL